MSGRVVLHHGDSRDVLAGMAEASVDAVCTDPPYGLGFMGRAWDAPDGAPFADDFWRLVLRVLKPGGHVVAFSGTRTYHRMACAIEDAGFEIRDQLFYCYGSGFPKSLNVNKALGDVCCQCERPEAANPVLQYHVRPVRNGDVQAPELAGEERGQVLFSGVSEQGASVEGLQRSAAAKGAGEQGMEGRGDVSAAARELRVGSVRQVPAGTPADGEDGRIRHGAPAGHRAVDRTASDKNGVRSSSRPRSAEQRAGQSGTLARQPQPQARGAWPHCDRCGKPMVPNGLGTALKPAVEPIVLARRPLIGTVAANVIAHGTGALNVDGCRIHADDAQGGEYTVKRFKPGATLVAEGGTWKGDGEDYHGNMKPGRFPANLLHDGSAEVLAGFPETGASKQGVRDPNGSMGYHGGARGLPGVVSGHEDEGGSAARFFYTSKADADDRLGSKHPTVKPVDLMQWLVRLVTPKGGLVLDPFAGTGTTGEAAWREGMRAVLIEREAEYVEDIRRRMDLAEKPMKRSAVAKAKGALAGHDDLPLFSEAT